MKQHFYYKTLIVVSVILFLYIVLDSPFSPHKDKELLSHRDLGFPSSEAPGFEEQTGDKRRSNPWVRPGPIVTEHGPVIQDHDALLPDGPLQAKSIERQAMRERVLERWLSDSATLEDRIDLARAYFPDLLAQSAGILGQVSDRALTVTLPPNDGMPLEIETRGLHFSLWEATHAVGAGQQHVAGAAFYGSERLFWTAGPAEPNDLRPRTVTMRVEEIFFPREGATEFTAHYEVRVPADVESVRDSGDYLEFWHHEGWPVLRMHYPVVRDYMGSSRSGTVWLDGVDTSGVSDVYVGQPIHYTLSGQVLTVAMAVDLQGLVPPLVVDPGWSSTADMAYPRRNFTLTPLLDANRVLAVGGPPGSSDSAEMYNYDPNGDGDPVDAFWSAVSSPSGPRMWHAAVLLTSGQVLVVGGWDPFANLALDTAEIYDPVENTWSLTEKALQQGRAFLTASVLDTGEVLVVGGFIGNGTTFAAVDLYNPDFDTWSTRTSLQIPRGDHGAVKLSSGQILVVGGIYGGVGVLNTAEVYNPVDDTWSFTDNNLSTPRARHTTTVLDSSQVLVAGGFDGSWGGYLSSAEVYSNGTWSPVGSMNQDREFHAATRLLTGEVLVSGGIGDRNTRTPDGGGPKAGYRRSAELYDPISGTWSYTSDPMSYRRLQHSSVLLGSTVLVAGGYDETGTALASTELFGASQGDGGACPGLGQSGDFCTDDSDCCSNNCKGKPGNKTCK